MVDQAAALMLRGEQIQAAVASGHPVNVTLGDQCVRLSSEARRLVANLRKRAAEDQPKQDHWSPLQSKIAEVPA